MNNSDNFVTFTKPLSFQCRKPLYDPGDDEVLANHDDDTKYDDDEEDDDDDDDEGWITPGNIEAMKQASLAINHVQLSSLPVACLTTDYAMQVGWN